MNESEIVETMKRKHTKLVVPSVIFVGMMVFLIPAVVGQTEARTEALVQTYYISSDPKFSDIKGILDAGKWIQKPTIRGDGWGIKWTTVGSGVFGGDEKGRVLAAIGDKRHVTFHWSNPDSGKNTCSAQWTGLIHSVKCEISQGPNAKVKYVVHVRY